MPADTIGLMFYYYSDPRSSKILVFIKSYDFEMLKWPKSFMFNDAQSLYFGLVPSLVQLYLETMQQQHIIIHGHELTMTMSKN